MKTNTTLFISKQNILKDSIDHFKSLKFLNTNSLLISYIKKTKNEYNEYEYEEYEYEEYEIENEEEEENYESYFIYYQRKNFMNDWIIKCAEEIIKSETFKLVPNGIYLTINNQKANIDYEILKFTGKLIATAFNQKFNINLKLTSFIWKYLLSCPFTIEDMKEYDHSIYQSLQCISENDVNEMNKVFVDSNGKNIKLTNENKNEYIKLMLNRIFLGNNEKLYEMILDGFNEMIDFSKLKKMKAETLRNIVTG